MPLLERGIISRGRQDDPNQPEFVHQNAVCAQRYWEALKGWAAPGSEAAPPDMSWSSKVYVSAYLRRPLQIRADRRRAAFAGIAAVLPCR